jgi:hypothetical protein
MEKVRKMNKIFYLIDFENVGSDGLKGCDQLKKTDQIHLFYTNNANKISLDVFQNRGEAALLVHKVPVKNQSADMHLVTYLGYLIGTNSEDCAYVIISKDTDFDNIIKFWQEERGVQICRASRIGQEDKPQKQPGKKSDKKTEKKSDKKTEKKPVRKLAKMLAKKAIDQPKNPDKKKKSDKKKTEKKTGKNPEKESDKSQPEKKTVLTPQEKTELNNKMQQVLSEAGKPGEVIAYVTSVAVKHAGEENCKQTVYRTIIAEYGQTQGRELYNRIRKYI